jgi:hypothetical protein
METAAINNNNSDRSNDAAGFERNETNEQRTKIDTNDMKETYKTIDCHQQNLSTSVNLSTSAGLDSVDERRWKKNKYEENERRAARNKKSIPQYLEEWIKNDI